MPVQDHTTPTSSNSVDVTLKALDKSHPEDLTLYCGDHPIDEIDFSEDKRFIRFTFPTGYSAFDIRVFEMSETQSKTDIMTAYQKQHSDGVSQFNSLWKGKASSDIKDHEFRLKSPQSQTMVVRDKDKDGTKTGTKHDYILKFTYNGDDYLLDPSIRNKQMN
tara:strand:- start:327 stop:812 length:486 start_codon:yes stop_codon:yes gene_type:complete